MNGDAALHVSGVCFAYEDEGWMLQDVEMSAAPGEFLAVLAANGSGKTTLLKLLARVLVPKRGSIHVLGVELGRLSTVELHRQVGLVLQNPNDQLFAANVEEDVAFGPRNLGLPEDEVQRRVGEVLENVGATGLRGRAIHHLSFGEQKRVAVAGVLAMRPRILLVDEPTAGLDPQGEVQMMQLFRRINRELGVTVVLATHAVDLLPHVTDRLCVLADGRVLGEGMAREILSNVDLLDRARLRLPHVAQLAHHLVQLDGVPIDVLPLTVAEARQRILPLIRKDLLSKVAIGDRR
jgi:cobalt/nickel transport system ATP-binding protein